MDRTETVVRPRSPTPTRILPGRKFPFSVLLNRSGHPIDVLGSITPKDLGGPKHGVLKTPRVPFCSLVFCFRCRSPFRPFLLSAGNDGPGAAPGCLLHSGFGF